MKSLRQWMRPGTAVALRVLLAGHLRRIEDTFSNRRPLEWTLGKNDFVNFVAYGFRHHRVMLRLPAPDRVELGDDEITRRIKIVLGPRLGHPTAHAHRSRR